jgi:hypothetical protein
MTTAAKKIADKKWRDKNKKNLQDNLNNFIAKNPNYFKEYRARKKQEQIDILKALEILLTGKVDN